MVILVVHVVGILASKPKRHAPVAAHLDGPGAFPISVKFMESQTGQIQILRIRRGVQRAQNQPQPGRMLGLNASLGSGGEKSFEPFVSESLDRHRNQCNVCGYGSQSG